MAHISEHYSYAYIYSLAGGTRLCSNPPPPHHVCLLYYCAISEQFLCLLFIWGMRGLALRTTEVKLQQGPSNSYKWPTQMFMFIWGMRGLTVRVTEVKLQQGTGNSNNCPSQMFMFIWGMRELAVRVTWHSYGKDPVTAIQLANTNVYVYLRYA